jgi:TnpA family transposase
MHYYSHQQLIEIGKLSKEDFKKIKTYHDKHNHLGFAYQLIFVRLLNYFPKQKPLKVVEDILLFTALQLDLDSKYIEEYLKHQSHIARHQEYIRRYLNLKSFDIKASLELQQFLFEEAQRIEATTLLTAKAYEFLKNRHTLQPSDDTLQRLIVIQREKAKQFIFSKVMDLLDDTIRIKLDELLLPGSSLLNYNLYLITKLNKEKLPKIEGNAVVIVKAKKHYNAYCIKNGQWLKGNNKKLKTRLLKAVNLNKIQPDTETKLVLKTIDNSQEIERIIQAATAKRTQINNLSKLQQLKRLPSTPSVNALLNLAHKLESIKEIKILEIDLSWLNNNYQRSLSKYVNRCSVHRLRELQPAHKYTALICFLRQTSLETADYMVDMHCKLMTAVYARSENKIDLEIQKRRKSIRKALATLKAIGIVVLDDKIIDADLRNKIFEVVTKESLQEQISISEALISGKFSHVFNVVMDRFSYLRQFTPALIEHLKFKPENGQQSSLLQAIELLREVNRDNKRDLPEDATLDFIVPKKLKDLVAPEGKINRKAWECALLTALRDEIKSGNISVDSSKRYDQFSNFFVPVEEWSKHRTAFFKRAKLPENPKDVPEYFKKRLNIVFDNYLNKQPENEYAQIKDGQLVLSVDTEEILSTEEEDNLKKLTDFLEKHMRVIKLPQLLIEVDNELNFTKEFMLPAKKALRDAEDVRAILVSIMAHGCFIGPSTMSRLTKNVSYATIKNITDWQLTEDNQRLALAKIVNAISNLGVAEQWGPGKTSSSDAQRFKYNRRSIQQTFSAKLADYALEFYTFVADNYAPYYSTPKECTERDAPYVLDGILYNESDLNLEEHYVDTHGYTEINYGGFGILGRKFNPRIRGVQHQTIYCIDKLKDYGCLTPLVSKNVIHMDWIVENWDKIGHFYFSLERGHATASTALKRLNGFNEKNHFYRATRELGRIFKTENILESLYDPELRRKRHRGLLKGEQIHQLNRDIAFGKRGKVNARDLDAQRNTCSCLTLIAGSIIYWQGKEIDRVISKYGHKLDLACLAMLAHISPISWSNVLLYGEFVLDPKLIK